MSSSRGHSDLERALLVRMVQAIKPSRAAVLVGEQPAVSVAHGMGEDGEPNRELIDKVVRTGGPVMENGSSGSQLAVPYKNPQGVVAGVMYVELAPPRRLKNRDLAILQGLGRQVEEKLWPVGGEPAPSAGRVTVRVSGQLGQAAVAAGECLTELADQLGPERGAVFVEQDGELQVLSALGLPLEDFLSKAPVSMPLLEHIWSRGRPVFIEDARNEIRYREFDGVVRYRIRSVAACPLKGSDGVNRGLIYLDSCIRSGVFTSEELATLGQQALALQEELGELLESPEAGKSRDQTDAAIEMVLSLSAELGDLIDDSQRADVPESEHEPAESGSLVDAELELPDVVDENEYAHAHAPISPATYDSDDEYALPDVVPVEPLSTSPQEPVSVDFELPDDDAETLFPEAEESEDRFESDSVPEEDEEEDEDESEVDDFEEVDSSNEVDDEDEDEDDDDGVLRPGGRDFKKKPTLPPVFTKKRLLTRPKLRRPLSTPMVLDESGEDEAEGPSLAELHDRADLRLQRYPSTLADYRPQLSSPELAELEPLLKAPAPRLYASLPTTEAPQVQTKKSHRISSPWPDRGELESSAEDDEQNAPLSDKPGKRRRSGRPLGAVDFDELSRLEKLEKEGEPREQGDVAWAFESLGVVGSSEDPPPSAPPVKHTTGELFLYPPGEEPEPVPRPVRPTTGELFLYPPGEAPEPVPSAVKETTGELFLYPPDDGPAEPEPVESEEQEEEKRQLLQLRRETAEEEEATEFEVRHVEQEAEDSEELAEAEFEVPHTEEEPEEEEQEAEDSEERAEAEFEVPHTEEEPEEEEQEAEDSEERAEAEFEVPHTEEESEEEEPEEEEPDQFEDVDDFGDDPPAPQAGPTAAASEAESYELETLTVDPPPEMEHDIDLEDQPEATVEDEVPAVLSESERTEPLAFTAAPGSTIQISPEDAAKMLAAISIKSEEPANEEDVVEIKHDSPSESDEVMPAELVLPSEPEPEPETDPEHEPEARPTPAPSVPAPPPPEPVSSPSWWSQLWQKIWPWARPAGGESGLAPVSVVGTVSVEGNRIGESPVEVTLVFPTHQMRVVLELPPEGARFRYHGSFGGEKPTHLHLTVRKSGFAPVKLSNVRITPVDGHLRGQVADITLLPLNSD